MRVFIAAAIVFVTASFSSALAEDRDVVVIVGNEAKVKVGQIVRVSGTIHEGGQGPITVDFYGDGKLIATNVIRTIKQGKVVENLLTKEFEFKAERKGRITINVSIANATKTKNGEPLGISQRFIIDVE